MWVGLPSSLEPMKSKQLVVLFKTLHSLKKSNPNSMVNNSHNIYILQSYGNAVCMNFFFLSHLYKYITFVSSISTHITTQTQAGDVLLYDSRLLHYGMANKSQHTERPLLYVSFWRNWFLDKQNWGDTSLFSPPPVKL